MSVASIMARELVIATMDTNLEEAGALFARHSFRQLPVVDDLHCLVGLFSFADYLAQLSPFLNTPAERGMDRELLRRPVHQFMHRYVPLLGPEQPLREAARALLDSDFGCLPVVGEEMRLLGMLSWRDLMRYGLEGAKAGATERRPAAKAG
ncbi:CBS domain-containing protein [Gallaecimonas kandeliae]|uniref:CBS domain-containing protein n=1 Tax=Gallaecimonas kandeliae TaxID=3029055 RepID=UPI002647128C|nr:CBS domain-containing protein [Gallaecimonas kandeliae]WKE64609.1 CBS domain-containing protein [Gallaecimonas kandeliae]